MTAEARAALKAAITWCHARTRKEKAVAEEALKAAVEAYLRTQGRGEACDE